MKAAFPAPDRGTSGFGRGASRVSAGRLRKSSQRSCFDCSVWVVPLATRATCPVRTPRLPFEGHANLVARLDRLMRLPVYADPWPEAGGVRVPTKSR